MDGLAQPSPTTHLPRPLRSERRGRGARRPRPHLRSSEAGLAASGVGLSSRRGAAVVGGARLGSEAGVGSAAASPRLTLRPRRAGPAPGRRGAGTGRGPGPEGPAPSVNIDAARVGVALLPLSEAVSRGPASA